MNHSEAVSFIWGTADLLRDSFKRGKYQDVILPLTVLRRIDSVLAPTKEAVLAANNKYGRQLDNPDQLLRKASGYAFYNTSRYDFERLVADPPNLAANLRNYIAGFSPNMREVIEKFDFDNTINKLVEADLLYLVVERFKNVDLSPASIDNHAMGTVFEELIRKFNEALNENPGEHFTPRDVVSLMVDLMLASDTDALKTAGKTVTVYDPCCGSGGLLTITKEHIHSKVSPDVGVILFGQEVNPETFAVAKSDMYLNDPEGKDADNIAFGTVLADDRHAGRHFDYVIANPPYGKDWKRDEGAVKAEYDRGAAGRFAAGLPSISDGQMLFLEHMISHMQAPEDGGSRMAIIMNGSPLFTGDAGSGPSEIRRWILEKDLLEAIVALPEQLFYNTGIATYVWVITNRKSPDRRGRVLLIDATSFWTPMRKSLGDKRREIPADKATEILRLLDAFEAGDHCRVYPPTHFGYRKITVERPLKLNFRASPERIGRLEDEAAFKSLAVSKKKDISAKTAEEAAGRQTQDGIRRLLAALPGTLFTNRDEFLEAVKSAEKTTGVRLDAPIRKAILAALSERDENADVCTDSEGEVESDPDMRDTENVPLSKSVGDYFAREVVPHASDAWLNRSVTDPTDSELGLVGYEIRFSSYFYAYEPSDSASEILEELRVEQASLDGSLATLALSCERPASTGGSSLRVVPAASWLGAVPAHWRISKAKYLFRRERRPVRADDEVVTVFRDGQVTLRSNRRTDGYTFSDKEQGYQGIRRGDLVVHQMDAFAGSIGVSESDGKATPVYIALTPIEPQSVDPEFYAYVLRHLASGGYILSLARGIRERSTEFRWSELKELTLPVPPLEEQRLIITRLKGNEAAIAKGLESARRLAELAKSLRVSLVSEAVAGHDVGSRVGRE